MQKKYYIYAILILVILHTPIQAQQENAEQLIENAGEMSDDHELMELLQELELHPININTASAEQLAILPWISDILAKNIVEYRKKYGKFTDIRQLENVEGFGAALVTVIDSYITLESSPAIQPQFSLRTRVQRKLQQSKGFKSGIYHKTPERIYNRIEASLGDKITAGAILERDPGEKEINDYQSFFIQYTPSDKFKITAGNYYLEFGQGLVFWNPYAKYKSIYPSYSAKKYGRDIKPYTLVDENASLYGVAGQFWTKFCQLYLFFSNHSLDASTDEGSFNVTNLDESGYHRSESERAKKDVLQENLIGSRIRFMPLANLTIGTTGYISRFNKPFVNTDMARKRFQFTGRENSVIGVDFNYLIGNFSFFGELASSGKSSLAAISGLLLNGKNADFSLLYRNYSANFHSFHGSGFGEHGDDLQNEIGFFLNGRFRLTKQFVLSFYHDVYKFPWRTYLNPEPGHGNDFQIVAEYRPFPRAKIYLHIRQKGKPDIQELKDNQIGSQRWTIISKKTNYRFKFDYEAVRNLSFSFRWEGTEFNSPSIYDKINCKTSTGSLLSQRISYRLNRRLRITGQLTFFDTEDYDARLYQFEPDIPGLLTNQLLYGKGTRWFILVNGKFSPIFHAAIKISSSHYYFQSSLGSGNDAITGNSLFQISAQFQFIWQ